MVTELFPRKLQLFSSTAFKGFPSQRLGHQPPARMSLGEEAGLGDGAGKRTDFLLPSVAESKVQIYSRGTLPTEESFRQPCCRGPPPSAGAVGPRFQGDMA